MGYYKSNNKKAKILRHTPRSKLNRGCQAKSITEILPSIVWKGKTCFLLGGGPSLKDFDFGLIRNFPTIGVNKSFVAYSTDILYAMDNCFYDMVTSEAEQWKELHRRWLAFKGIKLFLCRGKKVGFSKDVYIVNDLRRKVVSYSLTQGIYGGNNSGFGALMLAIAFGCTRIGLLGYDLKVKKEGPKIITHWHGGYARSRASTFQGKLDKFRECFKEFAPTLVKEKIEIVNLNSDSALKCFPKEDIKTFLK